MPGSIIHGPIGPADRTYDESGRHRYPLPYVQPPPGLIVDTPYSTLTYVGISPRLPQHSRDEHQHRPPPIEVHHDRHGNWWYATPKHPGDGVYAQGKVNAPITHGSVPPLPSSVPPTPYNPNPHALVTAGRRSTA
jgi:hypothetical protein